MLRLVRLSPATLLSLLLRLLHLPLSLLLRLGHLSLKVLQRGGLRLRKRLGPLARSLLPFSSGAPRSASTLRAPTTAISQGGEACGGPRALEGLASDPEPGAPAHKQWASAPRFARARALSP